ncbi:MAG: radical SAM protein [Desulfarculaceae bacterium]|nr:radical SAM protein [Desulfarculaceae bacterium]
MIKDNSQAMQQDAISFSNVPDLAELELTNQCNAACVFCPRHVIGESRYMDDYTYSRSLDRLEESGVTHVKFAGFGEPTLHPGILYHMSEATKRGFKVMLNTNGSRLGSIGEDELMCLCDEIIVSIHSMDRGEHRSICQRDFYHNLHRSLRRMHKMTESRQCQITLYIVHCSLNSASVGYAAAKDIYPRFSIRMSNVSNRTVPGFVDIYLPHGRVGQYRHYAGGWAERGKNCGYATAAVCIDALGRYVLCTNDAPGLSAVPNVFSRSIEEVRIAWAKEIEAGRIPAPCRTCDSF